MNEKYVEEAPSNDDNYIVPQGHYKPIQIPVAHHVHSSTSSSVAGSSTEKLRNSKIYIPRSSTGNDGDEDL